MTADDALPPLDWQRMPLHGRVLIEASAGTGKTWNIGLIYLRLLLEQGLRAEQILVTTFTDAAAQELRERLRRRLIEAERLLQSTASDESADPTSLAAYLAVLRRSGDDAGRLALRRIQLARAELDRAPIATMHALCQRIQRDYPLESGAAFSADRLFDEGELLRECVEDFWRRRYLDQAIDAEEAELVLPDGPQGLLRDLGALFAGQARVLEVDGPAALARALADLGTAEAVTELRRLAETKGLYAPRRTALSGRLRSIAEALASVPANEAVLIEKLGEYFSPEEILAQQAADAAERLGDHPLIQQLQALREALKLRKTFVRGRVLAEAARFCREEMPRRARARGVLTYTMLIDVVWQRLCGEHADGRLADRLFAAHPVALIDEFQDTDTRQYAIFERIYRGRGALVMIGDPKQAIYGFRGGDIAAYLRAGASTTERYSLAVNHRSASALVHALNGLYGHADGGFDHPLIRYRQVAAGARADALPYAVDGMPVTQPLVVHQFCPEPRREDGKPLPQSELERLALDDCAERIVELLNDPAQRLGDRRVEPGDIAVLLPRHAHVAALRARLVARGVPCLGLSRGSIFATAMAAELDLVLYAVIHAEDDQAVRGALSTRLLGADLAQFAAWRHDAAAFERELERFESWRELARARGVLALVEAVLSLRAGALLARTDGERLLTDLRHLGELLAAEAAAHQGLDGLYAWFAAMRRDGGDGDSEAAEERQLRIESDSRRVQLLTVHVSKGLEFPIVFLPLLWQTSSRKPPYDPKLLRFHDEHDEACVDLGSADFAAHRARHFREDLQERLRLLYVALTRAVHSLHLYWVDRDSRPRDDAEAWELSALDLLLLQARDRLELAADAPVWPALAAAVPGIALSGPAAIGADGYMPPQAIKAMRSAETPPPAPRLPQWLHSFSSLTRRSAAEAVFGQGAAGDEVEAPEVEEVAADTDEQSEDPQLLALQAVRGPRFGDAVHLILEQAGAEPLWPAQRQLLYAQLSAQGLHLPGAGIEELLLRVGTMAERVRQAELGDGLQLSALAPGERVAEFEFQFPVHRVAVARLRQLCDAHGYAELLPATLTAGMLNGMLVGFADLIFRWDGRFHVLDYKTNWLGARRVDYRGRGLEQAMQAHHYPLQALLYTVALHRYLGQRLDGYTIERHLGDSWYLFVRAVGLQPGLGVWRHGWPPSLIQALDDAFAGDAEHMA